MRKRARFRKAVEALFRVVLFAVMFTLFQRALSMVLLSLSGSGAFLLDTTATLLAALFVGWLLLSALDHRPPRDLGFALNRFAWRQLAWGTGLGAAGLLAGCVLLLLTGSLRYVSEPGSITGWLAGALKMFFVLLIPAAAEEALFRGYGFQRLVSGFGALLATLGASMAFALAHRHNPSVNGFALANIFLAGVMLSAAYLRTRSLWFATGVHVGWNWSMVALTDLPVSGLKLYDAPLYEAVERGPAWLNGATFGPEAGVAGLFGLLVTFAGVWWLTREKQWQTSIESQ